MHKDARYTVLRVFSLAFILYMGLHILMHVFFHKC